MRPIPVQQRHINQKTELMVMDDAEMALNLIELAKTTSLSDRRRSPAKPIWNPEANVEFASAASLIFDREECIALEKELAAALRHHPVAA